MKLRHFLWTLAVVVLVAVAVSAEPNAPAFPKTWGELKAFLQTHPAKSELIKRLGEPVHTIQNKNSESVFFVFDEKVVFDDDRSVIGVSCFFQDGKMIRFGPATTDKPR